jgi:CubicO group peptidase (beta-lactamase class C family)
VIFQPAGILPQTNHNLSWREKTLFRKKVLFNAIITCLAFLCLAACGGVSSREQALEATLAPLQTQASQIGLSTSASASTSFASSTSTAASTPVLSSTTNPASGPISARIDQYLRDSGFSGTILVAQKGKVLINQGYGLADRELEVPNTPQTKFAIGSMTKAFTAMGIMILQEGGKLAVEDPVCNYIADCPAAWQPITLHHLLTHTSGIPNFSVLSPELKGKIDVCQEYKPGELIASFKDYPLDFTPGDHWSYSNEGYIVLGAVIEKVSGESYETFIQKNVLQPLGMSETGYNHSSTIVKNRASGYSFDPIQSQLINARPLDVSLEYAAGGLYSTVGDLYKWDQALYTNQLVTKATLNTIFTSTIPVPMMTAFPDGGMYGYGWVISQHSGHRIIGHSGGLYGFTSDIERYPDDQVTVIVLSNFESTNPVSISRILADFVFEGE